MLAAMAMGFLSLMGSGLSTGSVPGVGAGSAQPQSLPALNDHAVNKHGQKAVDAWTHINSIPNKNFCKWRCPDGRIRYMCHIPRTNEWAVAVTTSDGGLITSFLATQRYARKFIEEAGCNNPFRLSHP
jgi:hypothetical protein